MTAALALINNIIEIRTDAIKVLCGVQRPEYKCAADIGQWQNILDILTTCSIITNCALVSFTSHGLYFYFPHMTSVEKVWIAIICEHVLLLFKFILDSIMTETPKEAKEAYTRRVFLREQVKQVCALLQPEEAEKYFYIDDDGEAYYGED
mmetsp:Transcript_32539/g.50656  ORF Transcript_32539/g.50656 Transcript_32539/m.50656 type:complete len:150 (+) Transcript_32539:2045-2494(+)